MRLSFPVFVWMLFMVALFAVGWKHRNTVPLRWKSGPHSLTDLLVMAGLVAIGGLYVWWANRKDFK
jgi:hypothetical protein